MASLYSLSVCYWWVSLRIVHRFCILWLVFIHFQHPGPLAGSFSLLSLRTCKADVVVGIDQEVADHLDQSGEKWRVNGRSVINILPSGLSLRVRQVCPSVFPSGISGKEQLKAVIYLYK
jgi:hypothetical protein